MYFYEIGYGSPEDSQYTVLMHQNEYSLDEIERIIIDIMAPRIKKLISSKYKHQRTFSDNYKFLIEEMVGSYDFKKQEYSVAVSAFGWSDLSVKDDWDSYRVEDDLHSKIYDAIHKTKEDHNV